MIRAALSTRSSRDTQAAAPSVTPTRDGASGVALAEGGANAIAFDSTGRTLAISRDTLSVLSCKACAPPARLIAEAQRLQRRGGLP